MIVRVWRCKRADDRGAIASLVAILAVPMIAISALAVDVGLARLESRKAQNATDAAAIAAAQKLPIGHEAALNEAARVASLNGFSNATGTTVTVSHPPVSGPNAGNTEYVEVVIDRSIGTRLGGVIGKRSIAVTARSVARRKPPDACGICAMNLHKANALYMDDVDNVQIDGARVHSNSDAGMPGAPQPGYGFRMTASSNVHGNNITVVGVGSASGSNLSPIVGGARIVPDPFAGAPVPSIADVTTIQNPADVFLPRNVDTEVYPGLYNSIVGDKGARAHFNPGLYVIKSAFDLTDGHTYTGSGVTFYLACAAFPAPCAPGQAGAYFRIKDVNALDLSAPTSGPWKGMLIYADRNNTGSLISNEPNSPAFGSMVAVEIDNTNQLRVGGSIYALRGATEIVNTNNVPSLDTQIVSDVIYMRNDRNMPLTFTAAANADFNLPPRLNITE